MGVDVFKDRLDVALYRGEGRFSVGNDTVGWRELVAIPTWLRHRGLGAAALGGNRTFGETRAEVRLRR